MTEPRNAVTEARAALARAIFEVRSGVSATRYRHESDAAGLRTAATFAQQLAEDLRAIGGK